MDKRLAWFGIGLTVLSFTLMIVGLVQRKVILLLVGAGVIILLRVWVARSRRN